KRADSTTGRVCPFCASRTILHKKSCDNTARQWKRIERVDDEYGIKTEKPVTERLQDLGSIGRKQVNPYMSKQYPECHPGPRTPANGLFGVPAIEAPSKNR